MEAILTAILDDDRAKARELLKADPASRHASSTKPACTNRKSFTGFTPGILRCIWLRPVAALKLFDYCWPLEPTQIPETNHRQSGPCTTAADGYISGPVGMQKASEDDPMSA